MSYSSFGLTHTDENWVFSTNANFIIPKSQQPDDAIPFIFKTYIVWSARIHSLKYLASTTFGFKEMGILKSEFVAKTQFLYPVTSLFFSMALQQEELKLWKIPSLSCNIL